MRVCFPIAAGLTLVAASALAQPVKHPEPTPAHSRKPHAQVVLASADTIRTAQPAKAQQSADAQKAITPRVTACRCGDPDPNDAADDQ